VTRGHTISWPQQRAHDLLNRARRRGKVVPTPCAHCGAAGRVEGHHHDYFKPLDVTWLCRNCHRAEHKRLRREGIEIPGDRGDWPDKSAVAA